MLDRSLTFERFVVGAANELAAGAALRAAESLGGVYNPLVICGGSGVGKTHLLHAFGEYATALEPGIAIHVETADFLAQLISQSIATGDLPALVESLGKLDLLLIDDLERLASLERTQEELATIAETMVEEGRQLVLTSVMSPAELAGLVPKLREVLDRGLIVEIAAPDDTTKRALAERLARDRGQTLPKDVLQALSTVDFPNVRTVHAAVERILEIARSERRIVRPGDVHRVVEDEHRPAPGDEFGSFLDDVSRTLAIVVEGEPWRRRVAEAILRWEGEGIRTDRLEQVLLADSAPDVDTLIDAFSRDAIRLQHLRKDLERLGVEELPNDPAALDYAEALLAAAQAGRPVTAPEATDIEEPEAPISEPIIDPWFRNEEKLVLSWTDIEGRLVEELH